MTRRRSSGSSWVERAVEPTRSQNITVSWRRSASTVTGRGSSAACRVGLLRLFRVGLFGADFALLFAWSLFSMGCAASGLPHWPQKRARGRFSNPQLVQRSWKDSPHPIQNFMPSGFSKPQLAQRIGPLYSFRVFRARKTTALSPSSSHLLLPARAWRHPIDILHTGIHGRQQLCPFEPPEGRFGHL